VGRTVDARNYDFRRFFDRRILLRSEREKGAGRFSVEAMLGSLGEITASAEDGAFAVKHDDVHVRTFRQS
jgi:hypothetical protein